MDSSNASSESTSSLSRWLARAPAPVFVAYAIASAFGVYFCMYAFRKPFAATTFEGKMFLTTGIALKTACVIGQTLGYLVSKYLGGKYCSEVSPGRRAILLVGLVLAAEVALLLFAAAPETWKPAAMFLNGLPLGMVWGLVVRYLEGRRFTETLLLGLSTSFIIAGAMTRDIGRDLVMANWGVSETWMPAVTGLLFVLPLVLTVWLLDNLPPPSAEDIALRSVRQPMDAKQRRAFLAYFGVGFFFLLVVYFFLTAHREFRDQYLKEMFGQLGLENRTAIFTKTENWAFFGVIIAMAGLNAFRDHRRALIAAYGIIVVGFAVVGGATLLFHAGQIDGYAWMAAVGLGMYLAYVPYGAVLFERMMAASRFAGTSVFAIQLADGVGYTGAVLIQLYHDWVHGLGDRVGFFVGFSLVTSALGIVLMTASAALVLRRVWHEASLAKILDRFSDAPVGSPGAARYDTAITSVPVSQQENPP